MVAPDTPTPIEQLSIKIFADGASAEDILRCDELPYVHGFTTNPTLMRKAGVSDYEAFARDILPQVAPKPVSLEVFADTNDEMEAQARKIASWGANVYVKIPVSNTAGASTVPLVSKLSREGVPLNVTAIFTIEQVREMAAALSPETPSIISVFAGRIADSGRDPEPIMRTARALVEANPAIELLWASTRELFNIYQALESGAHIITAPPSVIEKIPGIGRPLSECSLDTVRTFHADSEKSGYTL